MMFVNYVYNILLYCGYVLVKPNNIILKPYLKLAFAEIIVTTISLCNIT